MGVEGWVTYHLLEKSPRLKASYWWIGIIRRFGKNEHLGIEGFHQVCLGVCLTFNSEVGELRMGCLNKNRLRDMVMYMLIGAFFFSGEILFIVYVDV